MRWFKHDCNAASDVKVKKLLLRHGAVMLTLPSKKCTVLTSARTGQTEKPNQREARRLHRWGRVFWLAAPDTRTNL